MIDTAERSLVMVNDVNCKSVILKNGSLNRKQNQFRGIIDLL